MFWTSRGQLLRDQRIIPVTNISEAKPRALNTFLGGLAELGVEKRLRKNKKTLSDLFGKEKENQEREDSENNEEQSIDSEEDEETASEKSQSQEPESSYLEAESEIEDSDFESTPFIHEKDPNPCQHR